MKKILATMLFVLLCFPMSGFAAQTNYNDVDMWAKNYIIAATENGLFNGTSSTTFSPNENMTRGQFVTVLARYENVDLDDYTLSPFKDIAEEAYYTKAVLWAYEEGIVKGATNGYFNPNDPISRQDAAVILYRYCDYKADNTGEIYLDQDDISDYAIVAVKGLQQQGIMTGCDGYFYPHKSVTRAEGAAIFCRLAGIECEIYTEPEMTYLGTYRLTYYCGACNSPAGSRQTASGATATVGRTIAVPSSMYSKYKGKTFYIENVGYRVVEDVCGTSAIDIFCSGGCSSQSLSGTYQKIYLVND